MYRAYFVVAAYSAPHCDLDWNSGNLGEFVDDEAIKVMMQSDISRGMLENFGEDCRDQGLRLQVGVKSVSFHHCVLRCIAPTPHHTLCTGTRAHTTLHRPYARCHCYTVSKGLGGALARVSLVCFDSINPVAAKS